MLRFILTTCLVTLLCGCFSTSSERSTATYGPCDPLPCLSLSISEVPEDWFLTLSPAAANKIKIELNKVLFSGVTVEGVEPKSLEQGTFEGLRSELLSRYQDEFGSGGTSSTLWFVHRDSKKIFENEAVCTVEVSSKGYLGGAHDFEEKSIVSFEKASGEVIRLENLVAPYSRQILSSIAAIEFRRAYSIPIGQTLEESGFLIKNTGDFPITENVGVVGSGLMMHFNPYEIAPYSKGSFSFIVPFDAIEPILRSDGVADGKIRGFFIRPN